MTTRSIRLPLLAAMVVMASAMALPPATASTSAADRMLAAGAGQQFSAAAVGTAFAAEDCDTDAEGDVVDLETGDPLAEPRADIVDYCAEAGPDGITLTAAMATATDPEVDVNWSGSTLGWFLDVDGDDAGEFFAQLSLSPEGELEASVFDQSVRPALEVCTADARYAGEQLIIAFDAECVGSPSRLAVNPGVLYDQAVERRGGRVAFDQAPGGGDFTDPVGARGFEPGITRLAGAERIATAIEVSQAAFPDAASDTVVLARADLFPDALAGTPLAVAADAPILLTPTEDLDDRTAAEIDRVLADAGTVAILGGTAAISEAVAQELATDGYTVERYAGSNRFETAVAIARDGLGSPTTVLAADGGDHQDAILAGTAAPTADAAVLLTDGATVPAATQGYLASVATDVTAIGADAAAALPEAQSVGGEDPIATSVAVAETFFPDATIAGFARVDVFADALTGGAVVGDPDVGPGPMLFVETDDLPDAVESYVRSSDIDTALIFGGTDAISQAVAQEIDAAL